MSLEIQLEAALASYRNMRAGKNRYNTPWRNGSDGGTLAVDFALGKWFDHKDQIGGYLPSLAKHLGLQVEGGYAAPTKRKYSGLADYARAHGLEPDELEYWGWKESKKANRPCLRFPTRFSADGKEAGYRYRFLDGDKPSYMNDAGYQPGWFALGGSKWFALAAESKTAVLCNGEVSTIAGRKHGLATFCTTQGEKSELPSEWVAELKQWADEYGLTVLIALDCDAQGRKAAAGISHQFQQAGIQAIAVDLALGESGDLADFCMLHGAESLAELVACAVIPPQVAKAEQPKLPERLDTPRWREMSFEDMRFIPPSKYLIPDAIVQGGVNFIYGQPGSGKTFLAVHYAMTLAQSMNVIYVVGEGAAGMYKRGKAWLQHHGGNSDRLRMMVGEVAVMDDYQYESFTGRLRELCPQVIFIDTLSTTFEGDENSADDAKRYMKRLESWWNEFGATIVTVHHTPKHSYTLRGSQAFNGAATVALFVAKVDGEITVECTKVKDAEMPHATVWGMRKITVEAPDENGTMTLQESVVVVPVTQIVVQATDPLTAEARKVLETLSPDWLDGQGTVSEIIEIAPNMNKQSAQRILSKLKKRGLVAQASFRAPYTLTDAGRTALGLETPVAVAVVEDSPSQTNAKKPRKAKAAAEAVDPADFNDATAYGDEPLPGFGAVPQTYQSAYGFEMTGGSD